MEFSDYTPEQLIGMNVLVTGRATNWISQIEKVNKASFKVQKSNTLFNLNNGSERGGSTWSSYSASLITEEKAASIKAQWKEKSDKKAAIEQIEPLLRNLSLDELNSILKLIVKP